MKVQITKSARKEINNLDKDIKKKVNKEIRLIRQGKGRITLLKGSKYEGKIKVDNYRIRFELDRKNKIILITGVPLRKEAYRDL